MLDEILRFFIDEPLQSVAILLKLLLLDVSVFPKGGDGCTVRCLDPISDRFDVLTAQGRGEDCAEFGFEVVCVIIG